jgi:hypothetical protein
MEIYGGFVEFFLRRLTLLNGGASAMTRATSSWAATCTARA